jgi:hypothetical protein
MATLADEIINQHIDGVFAHLQHRPDLNQFDEYGFTPLIEAAIANNVEIAEMLIQYGADVNLQDTTGGTALHWAAENNNLQLCQLLLEHRANPNAYTFAGQPVLVMPLLRQQTALKKMLLKQGANLEFAQDFTNTKLLGHMFELVGTADILDPQNNFVEIDFEGFFLEFSLAVIGDSLMQFKNHFAARNLRHFANYNQIIINTIGRAAQLIKYHQYLVNIKQHDQEINALLNEEPLLIPVGYEGHAITFIKLGNIFVKCDRREDSRLYDNIAFYHVNHLHKLTPQFLKDLMYEKQSDQFINEELTHFLGLQPLTELKIEAQISGNCSWANVEACIPTLLFLLLSASSPPGKNTSSYKNIALQFFHQWREWNKQRALQFCIQSFQHSDSLRNACKAEILGAILFQRCNYKNNADKDRIEMILSVLATPQYGYILDNYIKTYYYESLSEEGKDFATLLKTYGYR